MQSPSLTPLLLGLVLASASCSSFPKELQYSSLESPAMEREMDYAVYTPPDWTAEERLPLVLFLHGGGDSVDCFDRAGIAPLLDEQMGSGKLPRAVIAVPEGRMGFWENWFDGSYHYRDWVLDEFLPHIQESYNTLEGRENLHLMGISMGGHGTLRFTLLEGDRFASVAAISPPVMNAEQMRKFADSFWVGLFIPIRRIWGPKDDLERINQEDLFQQWTEPADVKPRLMLVVGDRDRKGILNATIQFHEHLEASGIEHEYLLYEGGHKWVAWKPIFPEVLGFLLKGHPTARP